MVRRIDPREPGLISGPEFLLRHYFPQCSKESLNFFRRVVMCEADAQEAAVLLDVQSFREIQGVVISIPGEETALAEFCRELEGRQSGGPHSNGRAAKIESLWIADPINLQPRNGEQSGEQALHQFMLMLPDRSVSGKQGGATAGN